MLVLEVLEKSETKVEDDILGGCKSWCMKLCTLQSDITDFLLQCYIWHDMQERSLFNSTNQQSPTRQPLDVVAIMCVRLCVYWAESLAKLFSLMDQNSPERVAFVSRALKWSTGGSGKLGHPKLHQLLAVTLWKGILSLCLECMIHRLSNNLFKKKSLNSCPCALPFPSLKANMLSIKALISSPCV